MSDGLGRIVPDGDAVALEFERRLPHPVGAVWEAITEPAHREAWIGPSTIEGYVGGRITTDPDDPPVKPDAKRMTGAVLAWEPEQAFAHSWNQRIVEPGAVTYTLEPHGGGTVLRFRHEGLSPKNAAGFIPGTHAYLDRLAAHLASEPVPGWRDRFAQLAPLYAEAHPPAEGT
jgi:uncharacterized protein YndB with AHSA1/START domain